ncbi:hypothetical protein N474_24325 [Pseudoalteromonas luteoviolacea CPMOR-2]|uniref:metallophosphoesterase n=1 Tax=Pseudoalteromonas luteoviolacea TaxID=43657 RepID=UPI0007B04575|nr:metallophosphoesterase [Pseudoalteromonas luteoviolacea]KZN50831.1 hypothetical protein N474_24325 [Pseudoalteromonas luteoviolacea CPMOR-2]
MYRKSKGILGLISLLLSLECMAGFSDGPYVFIHQDGYKAAQICDGEKREFMIVEGKDFDYCGQQIKLNLTPIEPNDTHYKGDFPVVALSDIHGQHTIMMQLLKANQVVDQNGRWIFNKGHLVITGDIFDRGSQVTETLWYIKWLEAEALKAGGRVHFLLGNHEAMVLNGDLRYLHIKYRQTAMVLAQPFEQLFSKNSVLGRWLRQKNTVVEINGNLFLHGGLHPETLKLNLSLKEMNRIFRKELVVKEQGSQGRSDLGRFLYGTDGPLWYRGFFSETPSANFAQLQAHFSVERFIVGHTSHKEVVSRYNGRIIGIDSSIKLGHKGELLLIDKGRYWRADMQGNRTQLNFEK